MMMMMGRVWSDVPVGAEPGGPYGQKHLGRFHRSIEKKIVF